MSKTRNPKKPDSNEVESIVNNPITYKPEHLPKKTYVPLSGRMPSPEKPPPPLPDFIADPEIFFRPNQLFPLLNSIRPELMNSVSSPSPRSLRPGCYLIRYTPNQDPPIPLLHYDGTLRVERNGANTIASGDLYRHRINPFPTLVEPNPRNGIPIFKRSSYSYYVRVTQILEGNTTSTSFTLGFQLYRFTASTNSFSLQDSYNAVMSWTTAPSGYPSINDYLTGEVKNSSGVAVGNLTMGWVSKYLRKAVVEIDTVSGAEKPLNNGGAINWRTIFKKIGWDISIIESDTDVSAPSGDSWSDAEMHEAMLNRRASISLDTEWRYHILCVRLIDSTPRGIMYDNGATDSNNVPREGVGIATHWNIPDDPEWGLVRGSRFGTATAPFFRTGLHEIGHAMGLYHNTIDLGIMNTTNVIAASATPSSQFPNNIQWSHASDDQKRLKHMPDMWVRPGGIPFGSPYSVSPISPDDFLEEPNGLVLEVEALLDSVPLGAPVRVNFAIKNTSNYPILAPNNLSIKTGFVKGKILDPSGTIRTFMPVVRCLEEHSLTLLEPDQTLSNSLTLLRGPQGALFPQPGMYRIMVEVDYDVNGVTMGLTGETYVMVTSAKDNSHSQAALRILSTPDTVLVLAIGGDHLTEGLSAIDAGLKNEELAPHYRVIEARRTGTRFKNRESDLQKVLELLEKEIVASPSEWKKIDKLLDAAFQKDEKNEHVKQKIKGILTKKK